jgi:hypothetical protein
MKKLMMTLVTALGISTCLGAIAPITENNHRLYIKPDVSWNFVHKFKDETYTFKEWGQYFGLNAGYEFLKPSDFYAGIEAFVSFGHQFAERMDKDKKTMGLEGTAFKNKLEGRLGYTLMRSEISVTPFSGAGGYFLSQNGNYFNLAYIPLGVKTEYQWDQISIGLKAEQMHFLRYWRFSDTKESQTVWGPGAYGYELSMPISFKADSPDGKWYAAIEPYYLKIFDDFSFMGGRVSAIYQY